MLMNGPPGKGKEHCFHVGGDTFVGAEISSLVERVEHLMGVRDTFPVEIPKSLCDHVPKS